jgi:hypothetical protein
MRRALWLTLLASAAHAHVVNFDFVEPSGAGNVADAGSYTLQWLDSYDSTGMTKFELYAARSGVGPFATGLDASVEITSASISINDPLNLYLWDLTQVEPGCYQPFALVHDPLEGTSARPAAGVVTVAPADGGNVPPSLWFTTVTGAQPDDAGNLSLEVDYQDPEDPGTLELDYFGSDHDGGTLAQGLPLPKGGGRVAYSFPLVFLPHPGSYFVRAVAHSNDGRDCQVWWGGSIFVPGDAGSTDDAGFDAGQDAGEPFDGGTPDGGTTPTPNKGCGCGAGGASLALAAWVLLLTRSSRAREQARGPARP